MVPVHVTIAWERRALMFMPWVVVVIAGHKKSINGDFRIKKVLQFSNYDLQIYSDAHHGLEIPYTSYKVLNERISRSVVDGFLTKHKDFSSEVVHHAICLDQSRICSTC